MHAHSFPLSGMFLHFLTNENLSVFCNKAHILSFHGDFFGHSYPGIDILDEELVLGWDKWMIPALNEVTSGVYH